MASLSIKKIKKVFVANKIPEAILNDIDLNEDIKKLPDNYDFEIHKTIWRIQNLKAQRIALQMPEGFAIYACLICDIIQNYFSRMMEFVIEDIVIMGDVTYGACCVDDYAAKALDIDLLVHYGHSCLIPSQIIDSCSKGKKLNLLYIFVNILFDLKHLTESIKVNFPTNSKIHIGSTVQFISILPKIIEELNLTHFNNKGEILYIPRMTPLSRGEVLGCTAPKITDEGSVNQSILFIADGRFHLEALMIANSHFKGNFYLYNPYDKKLTLEKYAINDMLNDRSFAINECLSIICSQLCLKQTCCFAFILSTLGRQGSPKILEYLIEQIKNINHTIAEKSIDPFFQYTTILLSEITPQKLELFSDSNKFWVQIGCPRLSIDWGSSSFRAPFLTPYEFIRAVNKFKQILETDHKQFDRIKCEDYPMDYYAYNSLGPWTPSYKSS